MIFDHVMILGDDGEPRGVLDLDRLDSEATILMYRLAAVAGDDEAVDKVCTEFLASTDPDYSGYVSAATLSLTVRTSSGRCSW